MFICCYFTVAETFSKLVCKTLKHNNQYKTNRIYTHLSELKRVIFLLYRISFAISLAKGG